MYHCKIRKMGSVLNEEWHKKANLFLKGRSCSAVSVIKFVTFCSGNIYNQCHLDKAIELNLIEIKWTEKSFCRFKMSIHNHILLLLFWIHCYGGQSQSLVVWHLHCNRFVKCMHVRFRVHTRLCGWLQLKLKHLCHLLAVFNHVSVSLHAPLRVSNWIWLRHGNSYLTLSVIPCLHGEHLSALSTYCMS